MTLRAAAPRTVGVGAILALAVWVAVLPAATADETLADRSVPPASAPSVPSDAGTSTPDPSASVDPTASATPTPTPTDTATPEPTGPAITIGDFDCDVLAVDVTVSNPSDRDAEFEVSAFVRSGAALESIHDEQVVVAAGETRTVVVPLVPDAYAWVDVRGPAPEHVSAREEGSCGEYTYDPMATIGELDCDALTVPVVLDNSRSSRDPAVFEVLASWRGADTTSGGTLMDENVEVAGGHSVVVTVPLADDAINVVEIRDWGLLLHDPTTIASARTVCGHDPRDTPRAVVSVAPVDCGAGTVGVTIDNTASTSSSSSEEFAITSTRYPEDGGAFHTSLAVPGGKSVTVEVPVVDLAGGGLRVVDAYPDDVVLYEAAVDTECPTVESSRPTPGSTPIAAHALAATGASGVLPLLLVGFGLLTSGALLLLAASSRRV